MKDTDQQRVDDQEFVGFYYKYPKYNPGHSAWSGKGLADNVEDITGNPGTIIVQYHITEFIKAAAKVTGIKPNCIKEVTLTATGNVQVEAYERDDENNIILNAAGMPKTFVRQGFLEWDRDEVNYAD